MKITKDAIVTSPFDACISNEDEDDLTWLAENIEDWRMSSGSLIHKVKDEDKAMYCGASEPLYPKFSHYQWLQRRKELGLEGNQPEKPDSSTEVEKAFDDMMLTGTGSMMVSHIPAEQPVSTEWDGEGLPPVGAEVIGRFKTWNQTQRWTITYIGDGVGCYIEDGKEFTFSFDSVELLPAEQKAEEERGDWITEASKVFIGAVEGGGESIWSAKRYGALYDWLKSTGQLKGE